MVRRLALAAGLAAASSAALALAQPVPAGRGAVSSSESQFLTRIRQLTFEGRRAGEGYFSPDGSRLVFQSERVPGNPFFQIFELDFDSGETRRISSGVGKTTCAFHHPGSGRILFASTHHDPLSLEHQRAELQLRASNRERRYEWDFDPEMDLYLTAGSLPACSPQPKQGGVPAEDEHLPCPTTAGLRRLTDARGYDAEASFSPDGEWIVFASTRQAYDHELTGPERDLLGVDPSYFAEIYLMRADGSGLRRLTEVPGYDGGPFFSPDGARIVWRRFDVQGLIADVWSMNPDGSAPLQITDFGSMSWAPYPHPAGRYILFTSNKQGFENFELYIVDTAGRKEPVRVTYTSGFDGLPVPSPGGTRLAWTSNRHGGGAQILLAEWDHARALQALEEAPIRRLAGEGSKE